ncbi:MAG TPA: hypothetical protein VF576_04745 [Rubricoccaceae bacterium]|jgi:hypothetical protein
MADTTTRSGNSTAIVAIIAILAILALVWFFFLRSSAPSTGGTDVDVTLDPGESVEVAE